MAKYTTTIEIDYVQAARLAAFYETDLEAFLASALTSGIDYAQQGMDTVLELRERNATARDGSAPPTSCDGDIPL